MDSNSDGNVVLEVRRLVMTRVAVETVRSGATEVDLAVLRALFDIHTHARTRAHRRYSLYLRFHDSFLLKKSDITKNSTKYNCDLHLFPLNGVKMELLLLLFDYVSFLPKIVVRFSLVSELVT